jgi:hypothetical protein
MQTIQYNNIFPYETITACSTKFVPGLWPGAQRSLVFVQPGTMDGASSLA